MRYEAVDALTFQDLRRGHEAYINHEPRDAMYKVATTLVKQSWGKPSDMTDGIGVLLLTWNAGFYRYGSLDFNALQRFIEKNLKTIEEFKNRDINTLLVTDEEGVEQLFNDLLSALRRLKHKKSPEAFSPVAVAKTLHILAPNFFPLWDHDIAKKGYGCYWYVAEKGALKYWQFMLKIKRIVESLHGQRDEIKALSGRPVLKMIDEYNYSRFSKDWL